MEILTCYFNDSPVRRLNYQATRLQIPELWTVGDIGPLDRRIEYPGDTTVFAKEAMLEYGIQHLLWLMDHDLLNPGPIMWVDADIMFCSPGWRTRVSLSLDNKEVVQCFRVAASLYEDRVTVDYGAVAKFGTARRMFGGAWAGTAEFWRTANWGSNIVGGGDRDFYDRYGSQAGYVDQYVLFLPHGTWSGRQYQERKALTSIEDIRAYVRSIA